MFSEYSHFKRQGYLFGKKGHFYIQLIIKNGCSAGAAHRLDHWPSYQWVSSSISHQEGERRDLLCPACPHRPSRISSLWRGQHFLQQLDSVFSFSNICRTMIISPHMITSKLSPSTEVCIFQGPAMCTHSPHVVPLPRTSAWSQQAPVSCLC